MPIPTIGRQAFLDSLPETARKLADEALDWPGVMGAVAISGVFRDDPDRLDALLFGAGREYRTVGHIEERLAAVRSHWKPVHAWVKPTETAP